jgi:hypothetical protein
LWKEEMKFNRENDVRNYVRATFGQNSVFWVEAGRGGTFGMPDTTIVEHGKVALLELKKGWTLDRGKLRFKLRPGQPRTLRRLAAQGANVAVLVGVQGTQHLAALRPSAAVLSGRVDAIPGDGLWLDTSEPFTAALRLRRWLGYAQG